MGALATEMLLPYFVKVLGQHRSDMIRVDKGCAGALVWLKCSKNTAETLLSQRSLCTNLAAFSCVFAAELLLMFS